jgi:hypothetical protein
MEYSLLRHKNATSPLLQACVKRTLHASQKIIPDTKFSLTRQGSNFNVFDTFHSLEKGKKPKTATELMVDQHTGGDILK